MTDRREFVITSAGSLLALTGAPAFLKRQGAYDLVIRGGQVLDGTGAASVERDIAISGGKITAIEARVGARGPKKSNGPARSFSPGMSTLPPNAAATCVVVRGWCTLVGRGLRPT